MLVLKADPWLPDYGMGFDVGADDEPASVDASVETDDWTSPRPAAQGADRQSVTFVDGVRRAEVRLVADLDGRRALGLFGTYAVGAVGCAMRATFAEHEVKRAVVLGSGLMPPRIEMACGRSRLSFDPASEPGHEPDDPLLGLQRLMRQGEWRLAAAIADNSECLVLCDGPLGFLDRKRSPVVGVIKRFSRAYLEPAQAALLGQLHPGERTPLFGIIDATGHIRLLAWYLRLAPLRREWHDRAGLVRCEVSSSVGAPDAAHLADRVTALLPKYCGRASDPRAPQNLAPVAGLETWLRHRLGDARLVRRALLNHLAAKVAA